MMMLSSVRSMPSTKGIGLIRQNPRLPVKTRTVDSLRIQRQIGILYADTNSASSVTQRRDDVVPEVIIDNHDPFATVVTMKYGDKIPDTLETMAVLRNLGLSIVKAKIDTTDPDSKNRFYVTDSETSEKIIKSARLEEIRLAVLENLVQMVPESADQLNSGHRIKLKETRDPTLPLGPRRRIVSETEIKIQEAENGGSSQVFITTDDRPGLLIDVVATLKTINVNVVSAELDTIGTKAKQELLVTYHGEPLSPSMEEMVRSCLQYYISLGDVERDESY